MSGFETLFGGDVQILMWSIYFSVRICMIVLEYGIDLAINKCCMPIVLL